MIHPLIQRVEQIARRLSGQQATRRVARQFIVQRTQVAMRTVAEAKLRFGMRLRQTEEELARIDTNAR